LEHVITYKGIAVSNAFYPVFLHVDDFTSISRYHWSLETRFI